MIKREHFELFTLKSLQSYIQTRLKFDFLYFHQYYIVIIVNKQYIKLILKLISKIFNLFISLDISCNYCKIHFNTTDALIWFLNYVEYFISSSHYCRMKSKINWRLNRTSYTQPRIELTVLNLIDTNKQAYFHSIILVWVSMKYETLKKFQNNLDFIKALMPTIEKWFLIFHLLSGSDESQTIK